MNSLHSIGLKNNIQIKINFDGGDFSSDAELLLFKEKMLHKLILLLFFCCHFHHFCWCRHITLRLLQQNPSFFANFNAVCRFPCYKLLI